ncbi:unnamed protein product [Linum tenue]|uniref:GCK domain-containing protein n=3 Tax=Linum tenue TaxID=586396 RepID=A0AAV0I2X9_9ROSI|nr:unnamed protein product [Linum tenue]
MGGELSSTSTEPSTNPTHPEKSSPPPAISTAPGDSHNPISSPISDNPAGMPPSDPNPTAEQQTTAEESDQSKPAAEKEGDEEEEEGECGFCLFMKGGGCKDAFIAWEDCVKEADNAQEDLVEKCSEVTRLLKVCLDANPDYYEPILRAEKNAEEQARKEIREEEEQRKAAASAVGKEGDAAPSRSEVIVVEEEASSTTL